MDGRGAWSEALEKAQKMVERMTVEEKVTKLSYPLSCLNADVHHR